MEKKYGDKIRQAIYQQELKPVYRPIFTNEIQNILYEAIDQTREETIREVEEMLPLEYHPDGDSEKGYNACLGEIKIILNKLKK